MPIFINSFLIKSWTLYTGNLVYMTANNAPSPYVATTSETPSSGSPYQAFDSSNTTSVKYNNGTGVFWAKMTWTAPIRIVQMIVKVNRSGQPTTATRVYGIKSDASEVQIHNASISSNVDVTISSSDTDTEFVGVRIEIDKRSDLIIDIYNCRITQWYAQ